VGRRKEHMEKRNHLSTCTEAEKNMAIPGIERKPKCPV
jgi:hypothetical protein